MASEPHSSPRISERRLLLTCPRCGWVHYAVTAEEMRTTQDLAQRYQMTTFERALLQSAYKTVARIDCPAAANGEFPFQPEAVLPIQLRHARRGTASVEGIKSLMCAILIDALRCFQTNLEARQPARQQQFREARFWIFSDVGYGPFCFKEVCSALKLDPHSVKRWLLCWQRRKRAGEKLPTIRRSSIGTFRFFTITGQRIAK